MRGRRAGGWQPTEGWEGQGNSADYNFEEKKGSMLVTCAKIPQEFMRVVLEEIMDFRWFHVCVCVRALGSKIIFREKNWCGLLPKTVQEHHKLKYTDEALAACVKFASQYIQDRFLPDKVR